MKTAKPIGYVVAIGTDDEPWFLYGANPQVPGAIEITTEAPVVFLTDADARRAIRVSTAAERLAAVQGEIVNTDFTESLHRLRVVPLLAAPSLRPARDPKTNTVIGPTVPA